MNIWKKTGRTKIKKQKRKSWKKRTRGNCEAEAFQCQQKTIKKPSKNQKKTLRRPRKFWKTIKKPSRGPLKPSKNNPRRHFYEFWPLNATKGGARALARAPPLSLHFSIAKTLKNVSVEGFLRVLGGRGRVFWGFFKISGGGGGFF